MNFADNLKKIRKEQNLSQEQLAEKLGVSRQSVSKWESSLAYPEMDKMIQLCQLFNLNIDDLLNQDIKEVNNTKQSKNYINKIIDDFLEYVSKTIDMFSSMKFKQKVKCLFEQFIIVGIMCLIFLILGNVLLLIINKLFSFLPYDIYRVISNIFSSLYLVICLILGCVFLFHIFKVRYLDYYIIIKNKSLNNKDLQEELIEECSNKIILEKKEKIIIRDPKHSEYRFISWLLKCLLFIIKFVVGFISIFFCLSLILLVVLLVISFLFVKTGLLFIGTILILISSIIINILLLIILYNFIISKNNDKVKLAKYFLISLLLCGSGIGLCLIGITKFDIVNEKSLSNYTETEKIIEMNDELLFIDDYYNNIKYIEINDENIKLIIRNSLFDKVDIEKRHELYFIHHYNSVDNVMKSIRKYIKEINNMKIIDCSNSEVIVYTNKENIDILMKNYNNYFSNEYYY